MPDCSAREGPPGVYGCCREERVAGFSEQVDQAIAILQREQPDMFSGDRVIGDHDEYVQEVARILEQRFGYCARQGGPDDEVAVKNANDFSEQYDILYSNGFVRTGGYQVTCRPARF
jgi:hypothetical protein